MNEKYFEKESAKFAEVVERLRGERVVVLGHRRPDGDCIGSQVAMTRALRACGVEAVAANVDAVPRTLQAFVGDTPFHAEGSLPEGEYLSVTVDCADHTRVGLSLYERFPQALLNVDHHVSNDLYAETNLVLDEACATAEILAGLFFDNGIEVDAVTAQALYLGICTDTGQFCYGGTTAQVFELCRRLCECGAVPAAAARELYEREKPGRVRLLQRFLASFRMEFGERVCVGSLTQACYDATGTRSEDAENFVDYARSIEGVDLGCLLEERNGQLKGSLRAKEPRYRVDRLAKLFSGGGHACAAGFNQERSLEDFYPVLVQAVGEHLAKVDAGEWDES